jgi:hypothetical protein
VSARARGREGPVGLSVMSPPARLDAYKEAAA